MKLKGRIVKRGRELYYIGSAKEANYLLRRGLGESKGEKIALQKHEALYLHEFFSVPIPREVMKQDLGKYIVFRDLFSKGFKFYGEIEGSGRPIKKYERQKVEYVGQLKALHGSGSLLLVEGSNDLYNEHWFGQLGMYKKESGKLYFLDLFEATYLKEKGILKGKLPKADMDYFDDYYKVYRDWRDAGFVLKSGFKFGGDFRIYNQGISPRKMGHSKHVLHVFPERLITSAENWSRSIRVCHAVRKTYLLAVPSEKRRAFKPEFIVRKDREEFAVKVLRQSQKISGAMLQSALAYCINRNTDLMIAIVDRETSVTYYRARRVELEGSPHTYYEVEWLNIK